MNAWGSIKEKRVRIGLNKSLYLNYDELGVRHADGVAFALRSFLR